MKNLTLCLLMLIPFVAACEKDEDKKPAVALADSVTMGTGYANDIFYSFSTGIVHVENRTNWDIAFLTEKWSSSIIINGGANLKLFTYPGGDTTAWETAFDTTGILGWQALNNSDTAWNNSAFEANQLGHPDYGWGLYNSISHDVVGDSLYVLQFGNKACKKIWIVKKESVNNKYFVKVADLDGSNLIEKTIDCNGYSTKNFVYMNLTSGNLLDREPATTDWDILFTKYVTTSIYKNTIQMGGSVPTGVLLNRGVHAQKVTGEPVDLDVYTDASFSTSYTTIGYNWKTLNYSTFTYTMVPETKFFVKTGSGDVYKLVFTSFAGQSSGNIGFLKKQVN
ncbi:MAG: HmuY family protein [Bacteroidales bacterium]